MKHKNPFAGLTKFERALWLGSMCVVTLSFIFGGGGSPMTLIASLIGATALILIAKGNVWGQVLTVVFSLLYAVISFTFDYYGEMITYLGMTAPIAAMSVISWIRHPYEDGSEVEVAHLNAKKWVILVILTAVVTFIFYFILAYFHTANLEISTVSVATSFLASSLMMLRSPYYALAYASNDIVLIILWVMASIVDVSYIPMIICFAMFLINDIYGFCNWRRMRSSQRK